MIKLRNEDVEARLGKSIDETVLSLALVRVPDLSKHGPWICGGAVRRTIANEKLESDFDFFFRSEESLLDWKAKLAEKGATPYRQNEKNEVWILPSKVINVNGDESDVIHVPEMFIQLIKLRFYDTLQETLESFDFTICQFGYDGDGFYCGDWSLYDLARKRLVPLKLSYAMSSFRRMVKYSKQGFTFCSGGLTEMLEQVASDPSIIHSEAMYID